MAEKLSAKSAWKLNNALKKSAATKPTKVGTARVTRRDSDGSVWVRLPGSNVDTPVNGQILSDAQVGDTVSVRIENGRLSLMGNASTPSVGQQQVNTTVQPVRKTADNALETASTAQAAAELATSYAAAAQADADRAKDAADEADAKAQAASDAADLADGKAQAASTAAQIADGKAQAASTAAQIADGKAEAASASAASANASAKGALLSLATVEDVVDTLTWITKHGTMTLTTDTAVDPSKVYFIPDASGQYVVGGSTYAIVQNPTTDGLSTYYELTIDKSVENYIATHVSVTNEGLWLTPTSSNGYRVLIATGAGTTYTTAGTYIVDGSGITVAKFAQDGALIGKTGQSRAVIDYHSLQLVDKDNNDPYFHVSDLRDASGLATITDRFTGDGSTDQFVLSLQPYSIQSVTVDGVAAEYTISGKRLTISTQVSAGVVVEATYTTSSDAAKAYTLGIRNAVSNIGAMSVAEGINTTASGSYSHSEGSGTAASGSYSHSEGSNTTASGIYSHSEGYNTTASGSSSHAEGVRTTASEMDSHAEGSITTASGWSSHAEGNLSTASGNYSHAEGERTTASDTSSHAEGCNTTASGLYSHAEGHYTTASHWASHAEGYKSAASSVYSHAEGVETVASGDHSHAQNRWTIAASTDQTALGRFNEEDANNTYAVVVGNGTDKNTRSNALTVDWLGNVWAAGKATLTDAIEAASAAISGLISAAKLTITKDASDTGTDAIVVSDGTKDVLTVGWDGSTDLGPMPLSDAASGVHVHGSNVSTTSQTPSSGLYGLLVGGFDSGDNLRSYLKHVDLTNGNQGLQLETRREVNGSNVYNGVQLLTNGSGTRTVQVSDQAAWRSGLGLGSLATKNSVATTDLPTVPTTKGGTGVTAKQASTVTLNNSAASTNHAWHNGVLATVTLGALHLTSALASGSSRNVGTVPSGYRPSDSVWIVGGTNENASTGKVFIAIASSGAITLYNRSGASLGTGVNMYFTATYAI